jgi:hypothetical protein
MFNMTGQCKMSASLGGDSKLQLRVVICQGTQHCKANVTPTNTMFITITEHLC